MGLIRFRIIGLCNNATPFADGARSRPRFRDLLYGSAHFLEPAHGFAASMLAFYVLSLARQPTMHLQPHPACKAGCHCRSMRRPCRSMVAAGRSTKAVMSRNDAAHNRPVRVGVCPAAAGLKRATESTHCADRCANTASRLNATCRTISCADRPGSGPPMHARTWCAFGCARASLTPSGHPSRETTSHGESRDILISRYYTPFHHFPSQGKIQCHL